MKNLILFLSVLFITFSAMARSNSLADGMKPKRYMKRSKPILNVALVYYGSEWTLEDIKRIAPLLKERYDKSTNGLVKLNISQMGVLPYKHHISLYPDYQYNNITDKERLQRIWYYDNVGGKVINEVYEEVEKSQIGQHYKDLDALLVISGAQYDALGFANGRVAITEQPREIAWGLPDGGRTEIVSDENLVDELIHELGHIMFLGHTSTKCMKPELSLAERQECCDQSPNKNDVMSYCRERRAVDTNFFYGFEACNLEMLEKLVVPAMIKGKKWNVSGRLKCVLD